MLLGLFAIADGVTGNKWEVLVGIVVKKPFKVAIIMRSGALRGQSNLPVASETRNTRSSVLSTAVEFIFLPPPSILSPVLRRVPNFLTFCSTCSSYDRY